MKTISINLNSLPNLIEVGTQYDNRETQLIFSGLDSNLNYVLRVELDEVVYEIPINSGEWLITNAFTQEATTFMIQVVANAENYQRGYSRIRCKVRPSLAEPSQDPIDYPDEYISWIRQIVDTAVDEAITVETLAPVISDYVEEYSLPYVSINAADYSAAQKTQARTNIGAANASYEIHNLVDGSANYSLRGTRTKAEDANYTMGSSASALGESTKASGVAAVATGQRSNASGGASFAEGVDTTASYTAAHAEGNGTTASAGAAHAEGLRTTASASQAHAEGRDTVASGTISHAQGEGAIANHRAQMAFGQFNIADTATGAETTRGNYVEIVGNGTDASHRSNARTLDWSGNQVLSGKLTVGSSAVNNMDVPTLAQVNNLIAAYVNSLLADEEEY